ncbi:UNVERIFIED_CONTAM: VQ motif-containing protein 19 [Sesamum calycinum]
MVMVSPVSPLEYLAARGSPRTPRSPMEEEERAIAEKGFYLHPSPLSTPRGSDPPELLPLFPLHSPRDNYDSSSN